MKTWRGRLLRSRGRLAASDDCCCGGCLSVNWTDYTRGGSHPKSGGSIIRFCYDGDAAGQNAEAHVARIRARRRGCSRLHVWEGVSVAANAVSPADAARPADLVLVTTGRGYAFGAWPNPYFETTPGSGIGLDAPPYWYDSCQIGGYAIDGAPIFNPTLGALDSRRSTALGDGSYRFLILIANSFWTYNPTFPGAGVAVPKNKGQAAFGRWHAIPT